MIDLFFLWNEEHNILKIQIFLSIIKLLKIKLYTNNKYLKTITYYKSIIQYI